MELTQIVHRGVQRGACRAALVDGGLRIDYAGLQDRSARRAWQLRSVGVQPGDRVAVLAGNSAGAIEIMFACWWIGAVFCPLNIRWSVAELADAIDDCTPSLLAFDAAHAGTASALASRSGHAPRTGNLEELTAPAGHALPDQRHGGAALAALMYTGGTTGRSKGVMLTHTNLAISAACRLADNEPFSDSVALLTTPIFHIASITRVLPHLMAGGTCVLAPQFEAGEALMLIEREGVTDLPVVPTMLQMLLDHPDFRPQRLRSVRRLYYGAAPSASALLQRAARTLPWAGFHQYYGMTESSAIGTASHPADHDEAGWRNGRATSAGRCCSLVELRVVEASGKDVPAGEVGEILLRGAIVTPGYWRRPEETGRVIQDGWLHTGDVGQLDGDGYLWVVDRVKDMIVSGGENIYSAEVENALAQHPAVAQAAVIGIPHERWGEAVHAVVVLRTGREVSEPALVAHCRALIAGYKLPRSIEFTSQLPLTAAGKIAKATLREKFWAGRTRAVH